MNDQPTMAYRRWTVTMARTNAGRTGVALAVIALLAFAVNPGAADQAGSGIWVYNTTMTITVYNLTNYELVSSSGTLKAAHGYCEGDEPLQNLHALPFRTWLNYYELGTSKISPCSYSGSVVVEAKSKGGGSTLAPWSFEIAFASQHASGLAEYGNWISLRPHGANQGWSTATGSMVHGRWATPIDDLKMHNIMTLIGPKCMVALYSPDNNNLVIVVQQYDENASGWHDAGNYSGWKLDWVDNGGSSVPGQ